MTNGYDSSHCHTRCLCRANVLCLLIYDHGTASYCRMTGRVGMYYRPFSTSASNTSCRRSSSDCRHRRHITRISIVHERSYKLIIHILVRARSDKAAGKNASACCCTLMVGMTDPRTTSSSSDAEPTMLRPCLPAMVRCYPRPRLNPLSPAPPR